MSLLHSLAVRALPVSLDAQDCGYTDSRTILTFGMQRSGQHLVIGWICRNLGDCIHFNHCRYVRSGLTYRLTPLTGRRAVYEQGEIRDDSGAQGRALFRSSVQDLRTRNLLYSMEDMRPNVALLNKMLGGRPATIVLILRDPFNWLASSLAHGISTESELRGKIATYRSHLSYATGEKTADGYSLVAVDYGRFVTDAEYRYKLAGNLGLGVSDSAEASLSRIPNFGGGSSFSKTQFDESHQSSVFTRWEKFVGDPFYRSILNDRELTDSADAFFGELPFRREVDAAMDQAGH